MMMNDDSTALSISRWSDLIRSVYGYTLSDDVDRQITSSAGCWGVVIG